jgi:hypothetical protein
MQKNLPSELVRTGFSVSSFFFLSPGVPSVADIFIGRMTFQDGLKICSLPEKVQSIHLVL